MTGWVRSEPEECSCHVPPQVHSGWRLPGETHPSGALKTAGRGITDFAIRTYGRHHLTRLLAALPPLPEEAWAVLDGHGVQRGDTVVWRLRDGHGTSVGLAEWANGDGVYVHTAGAGRGSMQRRYDIPWARVAEVHQGRAVHDERVGGKVTRGTKETA